MQKITKAIAFAMALTLIMAMLPAFAAVFHSDVRVKLSIGSGRSFTFTPVGEYTLKEADSSVGTDELTVEAVGSRVSIKLGDKTYTGPSRCFQRTTARPPTISGSRTQNTAPAPTSAT